MDADKNTRKKQEEREHLFLSPYAVFSDHSKGRVREERCCDIRTNFQRDRDRILHSKAFRRLKGKTQVFLAPEGDHYRTRLTHTLEVAQIARTMAKALCLNEDLTEAIALAHDLGHTPFGHAGERALGRVVKEGFEHQLQSLRIVDILEKHGNGLNLTQEVRDGIQNHQTAGKPSTLEGKLVRLADKIAYINHDIDDAVRAHIMTEEEIPCEYTSILGHSLGERINIMITDIIKASEGKPDIMMSPKAERTMTDLRDYLFRSVYTNPKAKGEEHKAEKMIEILYCYYCEHLDLLPEEYLELIEKKHETPERAACDYVAGMTDHYAVKKFQEIMVPGPWTVY